MPDISSDFSILNMQAAGLSGSSIKSTASDDDSTSALLSSNQSEDDMQVLELDGTDSTDLLRLQSNATQQAYQTQIEQCELEMVQIRQEMEDIEQERRALLSQMSDPEVETTDIIAKFNSLGNKKISLLGQIQAVTSEISNIQLKMQQDLLSTEASIAQINALSEQASSIGQSYDSSVANIQNIDTNSEVGAVAAQLGQSFVGVINSDAQGNQEFSPGGASQAWCADFATSITKRAYEAKGMQVPAGFGSSSVSGLQSWGQSNGIYLDTASNSNRANAIATQVKPGDLMIQKRNGVSHTGIVTKVYPDGSFDTVEGNTSDSVKNRHYDANSAALSGFVLMNALG